MITITNFTRCRITTYSIGSKRTYSRTAVLLCEAKWCGPPLPMMPRSACADLKVLMR
jgi:hypothetical protein